MELINKAISLSGLNNAKSFVYTFKNHPLSIINNSNTPKLLMDNEKKLDILRKKGIDIVNLAEFDSDFMKISPEEFITNLKTFYNPKGLIVGFNYRFGYKNNGDLELLKVLCKNLNIELYVVDSITHNNNVVSSSRIRELIFTGNISVANEMLCCPFMLRGKVIKGKQLGRTIGFPTANLEYDSAFAIPATGVYLTAVKYKDTMYRGITSVGYNPTVETENNKLSIETYILDFTGDLYNQIIEVYFINRIRSEIKFNSLDELVCQLNKDKAYAEESNLEKNAY
jgi:riboflavin kinase/FMN adenylyltransferase